MRLGAALQSEKPWRTGKGLGSFAEAHTAATLVDRAIDNPYSTSEQYLERWANLIESRLTKEPNLKSKVKKCVAAYQRTVDCAVLQRGMSDRAFPERKVLFRRPALIRLRELTEMERTPLPQPGS